jgi:hypothetical protein
MLQRPWIIGILIVIGFAVGAIAFARVSHDSRLRRRRRKSHSPLSYKTRRPTVRFSVRPPKK